MSKKKTDTNPSGTATTPAAASLHQMVAAGDNRSARALARKVLAESTSEEDRRAAADVLTRTEVDRAALGVAIAALALVGALIALLLLH